MKRTSRSTLLTHSPERAAAFIRAGKLAAFPTETVYGLGANALDRDAVAAIFEAKGRPPDNPLIVHVADAAVVDQLVRTIPPAATALMERFFPGPLTLVLHKRSLVPDITTGGLPSVGVRAPLHSVAQAFLSAAGTPVAAPSSNRSGRPSPTRWQDVRDDMNGRIDCILQGPPCTRGIESTVVDCTVDPPVILRKGACTFEQMAAVVPDLLPNTAAADLLARSPGTRYRHYAPNAPVLIVADPGALPPAPDAAFIGMEPPPAEMLFVRLYPDVDSYAEALYAFFREADRRGAAAIYCQTVPEIGIGAALADRLRRAASG